MFIGLVGKKRSGKDTAGNMIAKKLRDSGKAVFQIKMAGGLKRAASEVTNQPISNFEDDEIKERSYDKPLVVDPDFILSFLNSFNVSSEKAANIYEYLRDSNFSVEITSNRHLLQFLGTEIVRDLVGPDAHVENVKKIVQAGYENYGKDAVAFVCTDVRFSNEANLKSLHPESILIGIERDLSGQLVDTHPSEMEIPSIIKTKADAVIYNYGSLAELEGSVVNILNKKGL